jgi:hypothetical protein
MSVMAQTNSTHPAQTQHVVWGASNMANGGENQAPITAHSNTIDLPQSGRR